MTRLFGFMTGLVAIVCVLAVSAAAGQSTRKTSGEHWVATWGVAPNEMRVPGIVGGPPLPPGATAQGAGPAPAGAVAPVAAQTGLAPAGPPSTSTPSATGAPGAASAAGGAPGVPPGRGFPAPVLSFNNQTVRMTLRTSIAGSTVRVRLFNAFAGQTVKIGAVHIAKRPATASMPTTAPATAATLAPGGTTPNGAPTPDPSIDPASDHALTFSGNPTATLYAGQTLTSDPVKMSVPALSELVVSIYFPEDTGFPSTHPLGMRSAFISGAGDFSGAASFEPARVTRSYYWLDGVDVLAPPSAGTIVTFGDSITDGDRSTPGKDAMWPLVLAARLQGNKDTRNVGVVNAGIAANRVLGDNVSGLARFQHEALDVPGVKWITVLEGINDISFAMRTNAAGFSADDLIAAYKQMIDAAHARGIKIIGCTITPNGGSAGFRDAGEKIRQAVNEWIRTSGAFDAVVDFDKATRDPNDPQKFSSAAGSPDMLHPGDPGYKAMADAFDLKIFGGK